MTELIIYIFLRIKDLNYSTLLYSTEKTELRSQLLDKSNGQ